MMRLMIGKDGQHDIEEALSRGLFADVTSKLGADAIRGLFKAADKDDKRGLQGASVTDEILGITVTVLPGSDRVSFDVPGLGLHSIKRDPAEAVIREFEARQAPGSQPA